MARGQSLVEKIVQRFVVVASGAPVHAGDFVAIRPRRILTHDNTSAVMSKFKQIGAPSFYDPRQPVFALDHDVQNTSPENTRKYSSIAAFAARHGVEFHPPGRGIGHQVLVEEGHVLPFSLVVASDSHANMYGGLGCLGTPVVRTDAAAIWATGQTWWQIPPVANVELVGSLPSHATGKDVIVALCGFFNNDEVLNHAVEFTGPGVASLSIDDRLSIANMSTEWGALAGVFPVDDATLNWLKSRSVRIQSRTTSSSNSTSGNILRSPIAINDIIKTRLSADPNARYAKHLVLDLSSVAPLVSGPDTVKIATPLANLEKKNIVIQKAYLVSCVNSRQSDIAAAANVVRGRHVAPGVELYVAAASSEVQADAERSGDWDALLAAGAKPLPAGCGPCIGLGAGLLKDGEVGISATNRNYKGRMGSRNAQAYLASPAVVAASAVAGRICGPLSLPPIGAPITKDAKSKATTPNTHLLASVVSEKTITSSSSSQDTPDQTKTPIVDGFPAVLSGELVFCDGDNISTDAIYPGKYTYQDGITPAGMARVAMENYDAGFADLMAQICAKSGFNPLDRSDNNNSDPTPRGVILVGGFNFGTGSSREQAATALLAAGVRVVIAGSLSEVFKRNAINNGLVALECPHLVTALRKTHQHVSKPATIQAGLAHLDLATSVISVGDWGRFDTTRFGTAVQEIVAAGGLEAWVSQRIATLSSDSKQS